MKALYLFLTICVTSSFNLFAQYYIGQDKLDSLKNKKINSVGVNKDFKSTDSIVYLEAAVKYLGYLSDVKISFDKLKYSRDDVITLTFNRTGSNTRIENENIYITGIGNASGDGFELTKIEGYGYLFNLKLNEVKKVFIKLKDMNQILDRIGLGIGRLDIADEGRSYVIPHTLLNNNIEKTSVKIKSGRKTIIK